MPPLEPLDPPEGDVVPYPNDILMLTGGRYLTVTGVVLSPEDKRGRYGDPVSIRNNTRRYWERRAAVAGYELAELMPQEDKNS
jgi:hypothetical protein